MLAQGEEEIDGEEEDCGGDGVELEEVTLEISLNSVVGLSGPKTMKMLGTLGGNEVVVMVDSGATHNFISLKTVKRLDIPISSTRGFGVSLGNGEAVRGEGECRGGFIKHTRGANL